MITLCSALAATAGTDPAANVVALTFDDGPSARYTPQFLDILKKNGVHATFFVIGG
jgi:peptidoglycan/xylan/chitin deacetylase (PgdA/CDA1 family)